MADNLKDIMQQDLEEILLNPDEAAEPAVFTAAVSGAAPVSGNVAVEHDVIVQCDGYNSGIPTLGTKITGLFSFIGRPRNGGILRINPDTEKELSYVVKGIDSCDGYITTAIVIEA